MVARRNAGRGQADRHLFGFDCKSGTEGV